MYNKFIKVLQKGRTRFNNTKQHTCFCFKMLILRTEKGKWKHSIVFHLSCCWAGQMVRVYHPCWGYMSVYGRLECGCASLRERWLNKESVLLDLHTCSSVFLCTLSALTTWFNTDMFTSHFIEIMHTSFECKKNIPGYLCK